MRSTYGAKLFEINCGGRILWACAPISGRDTAVHELYNSAAMLPHCRFLYGLTWKQMQERREKHRKEFESGTSCFFDIVDIASGDIAGTSGFRTIDRSSSSALAEFGIIIASHWQRKGVCTAVYRGSLAYARDVLGCTRLTASTLKDNVVMLSFLHKQGFVHENQESPQTRMYNGMAWYDLSVDITENMTTTCGLLKATTTNDMFGSSDDDDDENKKEETKINANTGDFMFGVDSDDDYDNSNGNSNIQCYTTAAAVAQAYFLAVMQARAIHTKSVLGPDSLFRYHVVLLSDSDSNDKSDGDVERDLLKAKLVVTTSIDVDTYTIDSSGDLINIRTYANGTDVIVYCCSCTSNSDSDDGNTLTAPMNNILRVRKRMERLRNACNNQHLVDGGLLILPEHCLGDSDIGVGDWHEWSYYARYESKNSPMLSMVAIRRRTVWANLQGGLPIWKPSIIEEHRLLSDITIYCTANEKSRGIILEPSRARAVEALNTHGICVLRGVFDPSMVQKGGNAAQKDFLSCLVALRKRGIDLQRPGDGPSIENFHELSMREARRCDIRNGPEMLAFNKEIRSISKTTKQYNIDNIGMKKSGQQSRPSSNEMNPILKSKSTEIVSNSRNLLSHPSILSIISEVMNPYWNCNDAKGNWGRWNFDGKGPESGPPSVRIGEFGAVMTLPGALPQTLHADTAHTHPHVQLPAHYINMFVSTTPITQMNEKSSTSDVLGDEHLSRPGGYSVGQTAFVTGSHILHNAARMLTETPDDANTTPTDNTNDGTNDSHQNIMPELERRLIRPQLAPGDALLFDCRVLHFGLGNQSSRTTRAMLYVNYTQEYFNDPKNWTDHDRLL